MGRPTVTLAPTASYERPVKARLVVRLENGEEHDATTDDLERFGLVASLDAYMRFDEALGLVLRRAGLVTGDITDARLNPVRYLVETALRHPHLLDHPENHGWAGVAAIERALQLLSDLDTARLQPLPWRVRLDEGGEDLSDDVRDANGERVEFTEVGQRQAIVRIVNAVAAAAGLES